MDPAQFLDHIKNHLAQELTANNAIRAFTGSTDLIGAHAEAVVREQIKRTVSPCRVLRGAIIYEEICPDRVPQLDSIISLPNPVPPLFQAGDFALVPRDTAIAYLEIKSTAYGNVGAKLAETLSHEPHLIRYRTGKPLSLGVVCLRQQPKREKKKDGTYKKGYRRKDTELDELLQKKRAVVLIDERADGSLVVNGNALYELVNFLAFVRNCAFRIATSMDIGVAYPPINVPTR